MSPPLVVVGAGPVGLTAALELTRRGKAVRILEKERQRQDFSKALAVNPRSLDLLEASGATERLLAAGLRIERLAVVLEGRPMATLPLAALRHRFPFMLGLPQSRTEAILEDCLAERGVTVERGLEVVGLEQGPASVLVRVEGAGAPSLVEAEAVLAADGAHSSLRKALDLDFPGVRDEETFQMIDAEVAWSRPHDEVAILLDGHRPLACIPLPEAGCYRFIAIEEDPAPRVAAHGTLKRELWRSSFQVSYRLADSFSLGRVHLAGDAAHIHSPIGARGMNLGIEDACFFAHCVAAGTLEAYGPARRAVARGVLRLTRNLTGAITTQSPLLRRLRDLLAWRLLRLGPLQRRALRGATGLDHANPVAD